MLRPQSTLHSTRGRRACTLAVLSRTYEKARALPMGKPGHFGTRILCLLQQSSVTVWLQHSRRSAESQDPFQFLHHHSKMGKLPPKHHSAAFTHRTYNPWDQPVMPASPPQRMQCCSLAAPRSKTQLRVSRRAHKQSMMVSLYHNIQILSMLALIAYLLDLCRTVGIVHPLLRRPSLT